MESPCLGVVWGKRDEMETTSGYGLSHHWVHLRVWVSETLLLTGRLGANCLASLRFSVPAYNSTLRCCWRVNDTIPIKHWASHWQTVSAPWMLVVTFLLHSSSSWTYGAPRSQAGGRSDLIILERKRWVGIYPEIGQRCFIPNGLFLEVDFE